MGEWVAAARRHGTTADEKTLMEWNAKTQVLSTSMHSRSQPSAPIPFSFFV